MNRADQSHDPAAKSSTSARDEGAPDSVESLEGSFGGGVEQDGRSDNESIGNSSWDRAPNDPNDSMGTKFVNVEGSVSDLDSGSGNSAITKATSVATWTAYGTAGSDDQQAELPPIPRRQPDYRLNAYYKKYFKDDAGITYIASHDQHVRDRFVAAKTIATSSSRAPAESSPAVGVIADAPAAGAGLVADGPLKPQRPYGLPNPLRKNIADAILHQPSRTDTFLHHFTLALPMPTEGSVEVVDLVVYQDEATQEWVSYSGTDLEFEEIEDVAVKMYGHLFPLEDLS